MTTANYIYCLSLDDIRKGKILAGGSEPKPSKFSAAWAYTPDQVFNITPKDSLITAGQRLCEKTLSQMAFRWEAVDKVTASPIDFDEILAGITFD